MRASLDNKTNRSACDIPGEGSSIEKMILFCARIVSISISSITCRAKGEPRMRGVCQIHDPHDIQACVWTIEDSDNKSRPQYKIEF